MRTPSSSRTARLAVAGLVLTGLGGCSFTAQGVACSPSSCSITLSGDASEVDVLGTTLSFGGVEDGRASITVAGVSVSCAEGESVSADPLQLECTSVTEDAVELTASAF